MRPCLTLMAHSAPNTNYFDAQWLDRVSVGLDDDGRHLLMKAVDWAQERLEGAAATTGEPLNRHCAGAAVILAGLGSDAATRASALLSVTPEQGEASGEKQDVVLKAFGPEIATLVQGTRALLRLARVTAQARDTRVGGVDQKEMQRKMLLAMA